MCQARDCLTRLGRKVNLVHIQVSCYNAMMTTRNVGLRRKEIQALETIREEINRLRNVIPPGPTNDKLVRVAQPSLEISELPIQLYLAWPQVTETQMQQLKESCIILMPLDRLNQAPDTKPCLPCWAKVMFLLLVAAATGYFTYRLLSQSKIDNQDSSKTLSTILNRGSMVCGVTFKEGFATINDKGYWEGFEVDLCRAVAVGIFGKGRFQGSRVKEPVRFVPLEASERFSALENGKIDVLLGMTSQTLERTVNEASRGLSNCIGFVTCSACSLIFLISLQPTTSKGCTFSTPYLVDGLAYGGLPQFLPCVQETRSTDLDEVCLKAKICVLDGTTQQAELNSVLPDHFEGSIVTTLTGQDFYDSFKQGSCNLLAGETFDLAPKVLESKGYAGPYEVLPEVHTMELISMVTRDGDAKFSDFVNHMVQSLMTAEEIGLTTGQDAVVSDIEITDVFGHRYATMFRDAFEVVGPYGRLYRKHLQSLVPRTRANEINLGYWAAMFSIPFGNLLRTGLSPGLKSPTMEAVIQRGFIVVGITDAPLFAELENGEREGIDVDFAKALAAALFDGDLTRVRYVVVSAQERFQKLHNREVDVLARVTTNTMERDVKEPTTGKGVTYSKPNCYDTVRMVGLEE
jgi:general L-amino acid transport system substrate-binding protein